MRVSDELDRAYGALCRSLASNSDVLNVGIGFREEHGQLFEELSLRVYLRNGADRTRLAGEFQGIPVSPIVPQIQLLNAPVDPVRHATLIGGIKVSSFVGSGTLGAIVQHRQTGEKLGLTCAHVVGFSGVSLPSAPIYQPDFPNFIVGAPLDPTDSLGEVVGAEGALVPTPTFPPQFVGVIDAAVFKLNAPPPRPLSRGVTGLVSSITAVANPTVGQLVSKRGFVTGLTQGVVISISPSPVPWDVDRAPPNSFLTGQAEIAATGFPNFGLKGDSGSLVLAASSSTALGVLWAGGGLRAFMSPIKLVQERLNISVVW